MAGTARDERPIFVAGCPRSGTTLLQLMLHAHPRIAVPPETRFLIPAYQRRCAFGDLRERANREKVARFIVGREDSWFGDLGLDPGEVTRAIVHGPPTIGSALASVFRAYARRFGKPRWGDKRPGHHRQVDALLRMFPRAQIVHIVRDPRDCVASLKRMDWWGRGTHRAVIAWAQAVDNMTAAAAAHPASVVELQYERLVADPEPELRALCRALGEDYDPAMALPEKVAPVAVPERKHWHGNTHRGPTTDLIGGWQEQLEPWEAALCETVLRRRMARYGYDRGGAAGREAARGPRPRGRGLPAQEPPVGRARAAGAGRRAQSGRRGAGGRRRRRCRLTAAGRAT